MRIPIRLVWLLAVTIVSACTSGSTHSSSMTTVAENGCAVSVAERGPLPPGYNEFGDADPPPWVEGPGGVAVLFYAGAENADITIGTHGSMGAGKNSKILWITNREAASALKLTATNQATGETVTESVTGSTNFPTTPTIPTPGCWSVRASIGDEEIVTVHLRAVDFE